MLPVTITKMSGVNNEFHIISLEMPPIPKTIPCYVICIILFDEY